jgi:hypothetical protein
MDFMEAVDRVTDLLNRIGADLQIHSRCSIWINCLSADQGLMGHVTARRMVLFDHDDGELRGRYTAEIVRLEDQTYRVRVDYPSGRFEASRWPDGLVRGIANEILMDAGLA